MTIRVCTKRGVEPSRAGSLPTAPSCRAPSKTLGTRQNTLQTRSGEASKMRLKTHSELHDNKGLYQTRSRTESSGEPPDGAIVSGTLENARNAPEHAPDPIGRGVKNETQNTQ